MVGEVLGEKAEQRIGEHDTRFAAAGLTRVEPPVQPLGLLPVVGQERIVDAHDVADDLPGVQEAVPERIVDTHPKMGEPGRESGSRK